LALGEQSVVVRRFVRIVVVVGFVLVELKLELERQFLRRRRRFRRRRVVRGLLG
jgi:hypothetical protein